MAAVNQLHRDLLKFLRISALDLTERDLIERAAIEALRNGTGCDIEQVVTLPNQLTRRRLCVQVRFSRHLNGELQAHLSLDQDGERKTDWTWSEADAVSPASEGMTHGSDQETALVDSVTAIMFYSAAIDRLAKHNSLQTDIFDCCAGISVSARRILGLNTIASL